MARNAFDQFLTNCVKDSISGYADGIAADAAEVNAGRRETHRYTCPGCGKGVDSADAGGWCFSCWHDYHFKPKAEPLPEHKFVAEGKKGQPCPDCEGEGTILTAWPDLEHMKPSTCMNCLGRGTV